MNYVKKVLQNGHKYPKNNIIELIYHFTNVYCEICCHGRSGGFDGLFTKNVYKNVSISPLRLVSPLRRLEIEIEKNVNYEKKVLQNGCKYTQDSTTLLFFINLNLNFISIGRFYEIGGRNSNRKTFVFMVVVMFMVVVVFVLCFTGKTFVVVFVFGRFDEIGRNSNNNFTHLNIDRCVRDRAFVFFSILKGEKYCIISCLRANLSLIGNKGKKFVTTNVRRLISIGHLLQSVSVSQSVSQFVIVIEPICPFCHLIILFIFSF